MIEHRTCVLVPEDNVHVWYNGWMDISFVVGVIIGFVMVSVWIWQIEFEFSGNLLVCSCKRKVSRSFHFDLLATIRSSMRLTLIFLSEESTS